MKGIAYVLRVTAHQMTSPSRPFRAVVQNSLSLLWQHDAEANFSDRSLVGSVPGFDSDALESCRTQ